MPSKSQLTALKKFAMTNKHTLFKDYGKKTIEENLIHYAQCLDVQEQNGTVFAFDTYSFAVILPDGKTAWDLSDAYFECPETKTSYREKKIELQQYTNNIRYSSDVATVPMSNIKTLLEDIADIKKYEKLKKTAQRELYESFYNQLAVYDSKRDMISIKILSKPDNHIEHISSDNVHDDDFERITFKPPMLEKMLKIINYEKSNNVEIYFGDRYKPILMKAGNTYTTVCPIKV